MLALATDPPKDPGLKSSRPVAGATGYAIFDFDRTIVAIDTGSVFLWRLFRSSPLRLPLAIAVSPLALALAVHRTTRLWRLSFYAWIATIGGTEADLRALCDQFAEGHLPKDTWGGVGPSFSTGLSMLFGATVWRDTGS